MRHGRARRANIANVLDLGGLIEQLKPNEAIALGRLRSGLPDRVEVVTKCKLNGKAGVIARTGADLVYVKDAKSAGATRFRHQRDAGNVAPA